VTRSAQRFLFDAFSFILLIYELVAETSIPVHIISGEPTFGSAERILFNSKESHENFSAGRSIAVKSYLSSGAYNGDVVDGFGRYRVVQRSFLFSFSFKFSLETLLRQILMAVARLRRGPLASLGPFIFRVQ
jgi:hypothetical protein